MCARCLWVCAHCAASASVVDGSGLAASLPAATTAIAANAEESLLRLMDELRRLTQDKLNVISELKAARKAAFEKLGKPVLEDAPNESVEDVEAYLQSLCHRAAAAPAGTTVSLTPDVSPCLCTREPACRTRAQCDRWQDIKDELSKKIDDAKADKEAVLESLNAAVDKVKDTVTWQEMEAKHAEVEKKLAASMQKLVVHHRCAPIWQDEETLRHEQVGHDQKLCVLCAATRVV